MFVQDPHAITDADVEAVLQHLGEDGVVALVEALALFDGFARFRVALEIQPTGSTIVHVPGPRVGDESLA
jgi:alkylhydroperoxidase family enzyme